MPPKKAAQRRDRKHTLQEDLLTALKSIGDATKSANEKDEEIFPILREALSEGVDPNLFTKSGVPLLCFFAWRAMTRCFDECLLLGGDPLLQMSEHDALYWCLDGTFNASSQTAYRMVTILLNQKTAFDLDFFAAVEVALENGFLSSVEKLLANEPSSDGSLATYVLEEGLYRRNEQVALA